MKNSIYWSLVLLMCGGCASLKVQKDEVAKIKKVAVVGFSIVQDDPPKPQISFGATDDYQQSGTAAHCEDAAHANLVLEGLNNQLKTKMKWTVLDSNQVNKNTIIQERMKWQKSSLRPLELIPNNTECFVSAKIPEKFALDRFDFPQRQKLIESLGVDAIVIASIRVVYENTSMLKMVGGGNFRPRSTLNYHLYNAKQEDPIWMDTWARGEPTAEGTSQFLGMTNNNELNAKVVSSAQSAFSELMKKYSE